MTIHFNPTTADDTESNRNAADADGDGLDTPEDDVDDKQDGANDECVKGSQRDVVGDHSDENLMDPVDTEHCNGNEECTENDDGDIADDHLDRKDHGGNGERLTDVFCDDDLGKYSTPTRRLNPIQRHRKEDEENATDSADGQPPPPLRRKTSDAAAAARTQGKRRRQPRRSSSEGRRVSSFDHPVSSQLLHVLSPERVHAHVNRDNDDSADDKPSPDALLRKKIWAV